MDDDAYFRGVMRTVIERVPGFHQIAEAASGEDALTVAAGLEADLVLMDVRMPGIDGFEAASRLLESNPAVRVALMSANPIEPPTTFDHFAGSVAFVSKEELCPRGLRDLWQRLATT